MKYVFYIPEYTDISNGISLLWQAASHFARYRTVRIWPYQYGTKSTSIPDSCLDIEISYRPVDECEVVVYPENIEGNPLNGKRVCRYFMAKPYILNGAPVNYNDTEFIFAYSHAINRSLPQYNLANQNYLKAQEYIGTKKIPGKVAIYYGKCRFTTFNKEVFRTLIHASKVEIITRFHPTSKDDLYKAIASSEIFVSVDPLTSLIHEATLLGTPTLIADPVFREEYDSYNHSLPGFCYSYAEAKEVEGGRLAVQANQQFREEIQRNEKKTENILSEIEFFFNNVKQNKMISELSHSDKDFYARRWECAMFMNVLGPKSIYAWHLLQISPLLFSVIFHIKEIKPKLRRLTAVIYPLLLSPIAINIYRSGKRQKDILAEMQIGEKHPGEDRKIITGNKWLLTILWLF
jgi:hypothetical protein